MTARSFLLRRLFFPLASVRMGNRFSSEYRLLLSSRNGPRRDLLQLQRNRLQDLLEHAFRRVPFYRERALDLGLDPDGTADLEAIESLPVLTKEDIRRERDRMVATDADPGDRIQYSTSGSTGEPFRFLVDRSLIGDKIARYFREMSVWGIEPGTRFLKVWGAGRVTPPDKEGEGRFFTRYILRRREESAFDLDRTRADAILDRLTAERLPVLEAYTSTASFLAARALEREMTFPRLGTVVVSGETLTSRQRSLVARAFGARVVDAYGNREFGRVAFSVPREGLPPLAGGPRGESDLYSFSMESFFAEYIDLDPPDPMGLKRLVLTCFANRVQPFVRYDTGDLVEPVAEDDGPDAIGLPRWRRVAGRLAERISTPSGRLLSVHFFTLLLEDSEREILRFQAVLERPDLLVLLVVPNDGYNEEFGEGIRRKILDRCGPGMAVTVRKVDRIPPSGDGKSPILRNLVDREVERA